MEDYPYPKPKKQVSKRRMVLEKKTVVKVKIGANPDQKLKRQILPSDSCSWRKYGEKLIKGTPYPRGYYRCTTSKGCLAKKQVERSKEDASMIIITYTCGHNHPGPDIQAQPTSSAQAQPSPPKPPNPPVTNTGGDEKSAQKEGEKPYVVKLENKCFEDDVEGENEVSWSELMRSLSSAAPTSVGENELFDELGELPHTSASSSFSSFVKTYFFDERMLVSHP